MQRALAAVLVASCALLPPIAADSAHSDAVKRAIDGTIEHAVDALNKVTGGACSDAAWLVLVLRDGNKHSAHMLQEASWLWRLHSLAKTAAKCRTCKGTLLRSVGSCAQSKLTLKYLIRFATVGHLQVLCTGGSQAA